MPAPAGGRVGGPCGQPGNAPYVTLFEYVTENWTTRQTTMFENAHIYLLLTLLQVGILVLVATPARIAPTQDRPLSRPQASGKRFDGA